MGGAAAKHATCVEFVPLRWAAAARPQLPCSFLLTAPLLLRPRRNRSLCSLTDRSLPLPLSSRSTPAPPARHGRPARQ